MFRLKHMVHQIRNDQPRRHWIDWRASANPLGQRPFKLPAKARVTGVLPIAMPCRLWLETDRERYR